MMTGVGFFDASRCDTMPLRPNCTVNGLVTWSPFCGEIMYTSAPSGAAVTGNELAARVAELASVKPSARLHAVIIFFINTPRSEEHTSELQSRPHLVCRLLLEKKKKKIKKT